MQESTQKVQTEKRSAFSRMAETYFEAIAGTLDHRGTVAQRMLCMVMMGVLTGARLPGGLYACQTAMFAVLLRQGFCVPAAFAGAAAGFACAYAAGNMICCWQFPVCILLWLFSGIWIRQNRRMLMAAAVFAAALTFAALTGVRSILSIAVLLLTAVTGAGLSVMYDSAAMMIRWKEELDGETRPLCVMAVLASVTAGLLDLPYGQILAAALALYLTLEHAYVGGGPQAILCAGVLGGVASLGAGSVHTCAMLLCGGFLAGEIRTRLRTVCAMLMLCGMAAAGALLGGDLFVFRKLLYCLPGMLPFLLFTPRMRAGITGLIERDAPEEMTQSEAIAVRCASMIHAWARLYEDTAQMMKGMSAPAEENKVITQCIDLLKRTGTAAHQVLERTLSEIRPDDDTYRRIRYALLREGDAQIRAAYALTIGGRMEVMLLKPEHIAPVSLERMVSSACGVPMHACVREGMLSTQAVFEQDAALTLELGAATRSCSGEEVAGDSYVSRSLPGGRHILALSDGMGSGAGARQESHAALSLLVESLKAGYTRTQAIDVVNALMLMCTGQEMYATVDMCVIDLHSGEAAFEKLGACASYVVREGEVRALRAETLPMGVLPDVESHSLRMTLRPGDVILLMTDGVTDAFPGGEDGLRAAIEKLCWLHPQSVGERLIAQALSCGEAKDDMAVLCARVGRRGAQG